MICRIIWNITINLKHLFFWFEGQNDTYINQERKKSYQILQKIAVDLHFKVVENCSHTEIDEFFLEIEKVICNISS